MFQTLNLNPHCRGGQIYTERLCRCVICTLYIEDRTLLSLNIWDIWICLSLFDFFIWFLFFTPAKRRTGVGGCTCAESIISVSWFIFDLIIMTGSGFLNCGFQPKIDYVWGSSLWSVSMSLDSRTREWITNLCLGLKMFKKSRWCEEE